MISLVRMNTIKLKQKIEKEFLNSCDLLQTIVDLLPMRILWKDVAFKYRGCNKVFAKDVGKTDSKELIGKDDFQMPWRPGEAERIREMDISLIKSGKPIQNIENYQIAVNGDKLWLKSDRFPLRDNNGKIIGILVTYEDRTEQKNSEEMIKTKLKEIEKMNKLMIGRELKMIELKTEIKKLKGEIV